MDSLKCPATGNNFSTVMIPGNPLAAIFTYVNVGRPLGFFFSRHAYTVPS